MKSILDLEPNDCRFPLGDQNFTFCALPKHLHIRNGKMVQSPYCREHHLICIMEPEVKRAVA